MILIAIFRVKMWQRCKLEAANGSAAWFLELSVSDKSHWKGLQQRTSGLLHRERPAVRAATHLPALCRIYFRTRTRNTKQVN